MLTYLNHCLNYYDITNIDSYMQGYQKMLSEIRDECKKHYRNRLYAILQIGSSLRTTNKPNDIDLIVILRDQETLSDIAALRVILSRYNFNFDAQILSLVYINKLTFAHFSHGQFFALFLAQAPVIFGRNPFIKLHISRIDTVKSVIQKMQYYYFRAKAYILENRHKGILTRYEFRYHRKKILFMLVDYYLAETGKILEINSEKDIVKILDTLGLHHLKNDKFFSAEYIKVNFRKVFIYYQILFESIVTKLNKKLIELDK